MKIVEMQGPSGVPAVFTIRFRLYLHASSISLSRLEVDSSFGDWPCWGQTLFLKVEGGVNNHLLRLSANPNHEGQQLEKMQKPRRKNTARLQASNLTPGSSVGLQEHSQVRLSKNHAWKCVGPWSTSASVGCASS